MAQRYIIIVTILLLVRYMGPSHTVQSALGATSNEPKRIAVFISHDIEVYQIALKEIQQRLKEESFKTVWDIHQMKGSAGNALEGLKEAKANGTRLIIAFGRIASEMACQGAGQTPIVAGVVLNTKCLIESGNATGVTMAFSPDLSFKWILKTLPTTKTIGVLYNPDENQLNIKNASDAARKLGLTLLAEAVRKPSAIPAALKKISKGSDVVWGIPDTMVLNAKTAKAILLSCFRNRIPFVGPSLNWAKAGAFQALGQDYQKIGSQCATLAIRILEGEEAGSIPIQTPENAVCYVNQKVAQQLKIGLQEQTRSVIKFLQ